MNSKDLKKAFLSQSNVTYNGAAYKLIAIKYVIKDKRVLETAELKDLKQNSLITVLGKEVAL